MEPAEMTDIKKARFNDIAKRFADGSIYAPFSVPRRKSNEQFYEKLRRLKTKQSDELIGKYHFCTDCGRLFEFNATTEFKKMKCLVETDCEGYIPESNKVTMTKTMFTDVLIEAAKLASCNQVEIDDNDIDLPATWSKKKCNEFLDKLAKAARAKYFEKAESNGDDYMNDHESDEDPTKQYFI